MRYKALFVAHWFSPRPKVDFDETSPLAVYAINFRYLISLVAHEWLNLNMMDVVTTYLYDSLYSDIYQRYIILDLKKAIPSNLIIIFMGQSNLNTCGIMILMNTC